MGSTVLYDFFPAVSYGAVSTTETAHGDKGWGLKINPDGTVESYSIDYSETGVRFIKED